MLAAPMLGACAPSPAQVPEPPAMLASSAEYGFGDTIAAADQAALAHVIDLLAPRYGSPQVTRYVARAGADLGQLRTYYDARANAAGWQAIGDVQGVLSLRENAIAYSSGSSAFAVVWIAPRTDSPAVPVNVVRFDR
ncbi:MAG: hypothetical protein J7500_11925 [Sphingomonas sp.]|uniref:hypothetical protein n=1 Tax=Sphingomonas sp. TaxID=28214 RepID=UPI001B1640A8|nr:hypothetical protein [Sphingomonas sp.]MBO9623408.1 hypothetical protein [Sphingomonas sp.]